MADGLVVVSSVDVIAVVGGRESRAPAVGVEAEDQLRRAMEVMSIAQSWKWFETLPEIVYIE